jgi:hypothetical protein
VQEIASIKQSAKRKERDTEDLETMEETEDERGREELVCVEREIGLFSDSSGTDSRGSSRATWRSTRRDITDLRA